MGKAARPILVALVPVLLAGACIAVPEGSGIPTPINLQDEAGADNFVQVDGSTSTDAKYESPVADPHAVIGVDPSHGPFIGGRLTVVRGAGFSSAARVWFGDVEVPASDVVPGDPTRIQVNVPPNAPGGVDVRVQNGDDDSTSRSLLAGYTYDPFYAEPATSPTSGGTLITLAGMGTSWASGTTVSIGGAACQDIVVKSSTEIACRVPPHPPGAVSITTATSGSASVVVYDAFTYSDSDNGFKGGLSGAKLSGTLRVAAFNAYTGEPVSQALVIAGDSQANSLQQLTDGAGIAVFNDIALTGKRSVTIAKTCYSPATFVDVPVDTVTAYMMPVMSPDCGADGGDVPPTGGSGSNPSYISGELVWKEGVEFKPGVWTNVPGPKSPDERRAAYVFSPSWDPTYAFQLPDSSVAVTPESGGELGSSFSVSSGAGNMTLYALAGIENRALTPAVFSAYAFGLVQGVSTLPGQTTEDVYIVMDKPLDQAIVLSATPPAAGPKGPDRLVASVAVQLGNVGYALFPNAQRTVPIAGTGPMTFVGLPGLEGSLSGAQFVSSASAVTGANLGPPKSIVGKFLTADATIPVQIGGFVQVPVLTVPGQAQPFDGRHLAVSYAPGGAFIDVTVFRVSAGAGLMEWFVVAPAGKTEIELPDLSATGGGIPPGPVIISVYAGHIDDNGFDYGTLLYRHTDSRGWLAYSYDAFHTYH